MRTTMKTLETGKDKIKKICDLLRHETLEPALEEAHQIVEKAKERAAEIIKEAENQAHQHLQQAKQQIEQERNVFHSSMQQGAKQAIEALKQEIETKFYSQDLQSVLEKNLSDNKTIAQLINGILAALEKEGIGTDLSIVIPKTVSSKEVIALLLDSVKKRLQDRPMELEKFKGGVRVKLEGKRMTIDLSDEAIKELLANYIRKDFRQIVFSH